MWAYVYLSTHIYEYSTQKVCDNSKWNTPYFLLNSPDRRISTNNSWRHVRCNSLVPLILKSCTALPFNMSMCPFTASRATTLNSLLTSLNLLISPRLIKEQRPSPTHFSSRVGTLLKRSTKFMMSQSGLSTSMTANTDMSETKLVLGKDGCNHTVCYEWKNVAYIYGLGFHWSKNSVFRLISTPVKILLEEELLASGHWNFLDDPIIARLKQEDGVCVQVDTLRMSWHFYQIDWGQTFATELPCVHKKSFTSPTNYNVLAGDRSTLIYATALGWLNAFRSQQWSQQFCSNLNVHSFSF